MCVVWCSTGYARAKNTNQEQGRMCSQQARDSGASASNRNTFRFVRTSATTAPPPITIQFTKRKQENPQKGKTGTINSAYDDDNDDNHDELLVVPFQHSVSISDTAVAMTSILCLLLLSLSVMTQHLYSHWYFFKSINQSQSHSSDGVVFSRGYRSALQLQWLAVHSTSFLSPWSNSANGQSCRLVNV